MFIVCSPTAVLFLLSSFCVYRIFFTLEVSKEVFPFPEHTVIICTGGAPASADMYKHFFQNFQFPKLFLGKKHCLNQ